MSLLRNHASSFLLGAVMAASAAPAVPADEFGDVPRLAHAASRCTEYGGHVADLGSCGGDHVRVGARDGVNAWSAVGTSSAALRSDGYGMLPGASGARHLRVRSGMESYNRFQ